jgi:hypothetical protein
MSVRSRRGLDSFVPSFPRQRRRRLCRLDSAIGGSQGSQILHATVCPGVRLAKFLGIDGGVVGGS